MVSGSQEAMTVARESHVRVSQLWNYAVPRRARLPVLVIGFAAAYFLAAKLGIATSLPLQGIVIIWPPNASCLPRFLLRA
jgi:hypothetical protein